ncbi:N-acetyltransferase GCN5 [Nocardiopsis terrae]|uniref:GNAT family acetyltransferase n=1 Tax=Nocardiopsis terrae TaxID=372655 RepID=A0ABR9HCI4_9ACTN|nr:GNAT family N-acetyltransferase [Nocardiopsis terrae]MBE1456742.1 putative GNAT family acetyltransferase [Nocardiopsis terrae]GHC75348.1 N-acetyltransferase GCN5 [Nocardiopsis terrae]
MLRTSAVRILGERDREAVSALLDTDPVGNVFVASRLMTTGISGGGAEVWGHTERGRLTALCYSGANLVPVNAGPAAVRSFADHARWRGRRCSSIVGPVEAVNDFWQQVTPAWGPARVIRASQPVLEIDGPPEVAPDPLVRRVRIHEINTLVPACVAMFTEEVGVPPDSGDGGALYRARVEELVRTGRAFARIEDGRVVFKAEIGAVTRHACQVQGVWVHPDLRGRGHSSAGMAAVVNYALAEIAPRVTLYVNDFNAPARATYQRVGFRQVGEVMSVLF